MRTQNFYLKLTLLLVITAMMTACGASKGATGYDTSSRLAADEITNADTSIRPLAYCNQASNSILGSATSSYQDGETISLSKINMKITKLPSGFSQNKNYIEVLKYMVSPTGNKIWGTNRLYFSIYSIADGKTLATSRNYLFWSDLLSAAAKLNVATPEQFFKKARIVVDLDDAAGEYDAVSLVYRDHSNDAVVGQLDSLIPVFDADPVKYRVELDKTTGNTATRHISLQSLHPFKNYESQGWTATVYQTKAHEFCKPIYTVE